MHNGPTIKPIERRAGIIEHMTPDMACLVHCAEGTVELAGVRLAKGDAIGIWDTDGFDVAGITTAELVLVEVPMTPMTRGVKV